MHLHLHVLPLQHAVAEACCNSNSCRGMSIHCELAAAAELTLMLLPLLLPQQSGHDGGCSSCRCCCR
jgi:hypothetical protein